MKFKLKNSNAEARQKDFMSYDLYIGEKKIGVAIKSRIEDDPDWIEQPEKDYEVLAWKEGITLDDEITSVKRLSDGEVFSVGDKVEGNGYYSVKPIRSLITKFQETKRGIVVNYAEGSDMLEDIKKVTHTPILTTEDGVELFEGDLHLYIRKWDDKHPIRAGIVGRKANKDLVYFSTREAAEEYRLWNAQKISVQDMVDMFGLSSSCNDVFRMQELVKSRL